MKALVKILVVDDEPSVCSLIKKFLSANGFSVITADNGSDALLMARESRPDVMLLDAGLPGLDGHALCRILRGQGVRSIPIIIMSGSMVSEKDVLAGFEGGADDYIIKPFSLAILLARIQAVLRRYEASSEAEEKLKRHGIEIDPAGRTVTVKGKPVSLTRKEYDLLATLLSKAGRVLSVPYLLETVWGYDPADYNDPGTVEVHVSHLRKKLGPPLGKRIVNVTGHGYKFED